MLCAALLWSFFSSLNCSARSRKAACGWVRGKQHFAELKLSNNCTCFLAASPKRLKKRSWPIGSVEILALSLLLLSMPMLLPMLPRLTIGTGLVGLLIAGRKSSSFSSFAAFSRRLRSISNLRLWPAFDSSAVSSAWRANIDKR